MAAARVMHSSDDPVRYPECGVRADALRRHAGTRAQPEPECRRVLQRTSHRRAKRDDITAAPSSLRDRLHGRLGQVVGLVERQLRIQHRIAGRRDAGGVGQGREADATRPQRIEQLPVEHEPGGRRLECDRERGRPGPNVP